MSCITTYTRKRIDPIHPDPALIDIKDIAHSLSLQCRGGGHVASFYSVGSHCIWCCRESLASGDDVKTALACLLHDASEAYLCDIPRPIKHSLTEYRPIEDRLLSVIYQKYLGQEPSPETLARVKQIDDQVLLYDLKYLLGHESITDLPMLHCEANYEVRPFEQTEQEYLELFHLLQQQLQNP